MKVKWMKLAGELLDEASNEYSSHGCNDLEWPKDWTVEERREFLTAMMEDNSKKSRDEFKPNELEELEHAVNTSHGLTDWWVMRFLAKKFKEQADGPRLE